MKGDIFKGTNLYGDFKDMSKGRKKIAIYTFLKLF